MQLRESDKFPLACISITTLRMKKKKTFKKLMNTLEENCIFVIKLFFFPVTQGVDGARMRDENTETYACVSPGMIL